MQTVFFFSVVIFSIARALKLPLSFKNIVQRSTSCDADDTKSLLVGSTYLTTGSHHDRSRGKRLRLKDVNMRAVEALSDAFVGGTVGVMSVAFILELRKVADQRLDGCPYCMGNGEILCGLCYGNPQGVSESSEIGAPMCSCKLCNGRGLVQCINCKGDGRITPILLQSKAIRDPDYSNQSLQERNKK